jgi:DNA-binding transcriptional ArsR family regulator
MTIDTKRSDGVRAFKRGLDVLHEINRSGGIRAGDVARQLELPRPTVYRLLETLEELGYVARSASDDRFRVTRRASSLGDGYDPGVVICQAAAPYLAELSKILVWPVDLSTYENASMVIQETTHSRSPLSIDRGMIGKRLPVLRTSAGRAYLAACARQAGLQTALIDMADIGLFRDNFVDRSGREITKLFKLYPWEWMFDEVFGRAPALKEARWVEPAWKMLLSNKGALALAWELAPGHPNLLPCVFDDDPRAAELGPNFARKPLRSREGGNVELHGDGEVIRGPDLAYGGPRIRQALCPLPEFSGNYPVLGCWLVGEEPAGMGIREDTSPITGDRSRFVPHVILG